MLSALVFSVLFHVFLVWTIFQCCFTSPIVNGAQRFGLPSSHTPAKRLVLIVVDGLRADLLFTPNGFPDSLRYQAGNRVDVVASHLRSIIQSRGTFGISHARVPAESIPGHVAIAAGTHEDGSEGWLWKTNSAAFDSVFNCSDRTYSFGSSDIVPVFSGGGVEGRVKEWSLIKDEGGSLTDATSLDAQVFKELETLFANATSDPNLHAELHKPKSIFFLHLPGLAMTGKSYGPFSEEYMQNIIAVDNIVREVETLLRTSYNEKEGEEETAYVFTSSHGMSLAGKHGDGHPDNTRTPLLVWGKGVRGPLPDPSMLDSSQGQIAAKTTHDRYSAPWGLGGLLRQDISQVDLAPLIATLLGIEWPKHSVGVLPGLQSLDSESMEPGFVSFVDYDEGMALAAEVNARVILEQLRVKEEHKRFMEPFYKPFASLSSSASLSSIAAMIQQREFVQARAEAYDLIQLGLQGLQYVKTYSQAPFQAMILLTYLGWMVYAYNASAIRVSRPSESGGAQQNVVEKDTKAKSTGIAKAKASWKLVGRTLALVVYIRLGLRFWAEKAPWTYLVYVAWPCLFWGEVAGTVLSGFVLARTPSSWVSTSVMSGLGKLRMSITSEDATKELSGEKDEVLQKLDQLDDIIKLLNEQKAAMEERKRINEKRWEEKLGRMREKERERNSSLEQKQDRRREKDAFILESRDMVSELYSLMQDDIQKREQKPEQAGKPGPEEIIEELTRQNQELRDLLRSVSESWGADSERRHIDTINAVRETAHEQIPFNLQGYLDEFSKALAAEVRILLSEVGKIREERRALQHELGYLLNVRSQYGPGGEFDPDWKPASGMPEGPPTEVPPPPPPPPPPPEHVQARPAWRQTAQNSKKKGKQRAQPPPSPGQQVPSWTQWQSESQSQPVPEFTQGSSTLFGSRKAGASRKEPTIPASSWATWQPDPRIQPTPPTESTLVIPKGSPGLFGPRTPRPMI